MEMSEVAIDNRLDTDRRTLSWRTVLYGFVRSRRRVHRRELEADVRFLDWHHPWLFFLAVGTMLLSSLDAFMTLLLIDRGMVEVNPVMAAVMGHGTAWFAASKLFMTATGVLVLVFLAKAHFLNRFRDRSFPDHHFQLLRLPGLLRIRLSLAYLLVRNSIPKISGLGYTSAPFR